jgi:hypothetical protein
LIGVLSHAGCIDANNYVGNYQPLECSVCHGELLWRFLATASYHGHRRYRSSRWISSTKLRSFCDKGTLYSLS